MRTDLNISFGLDHFCYHNKNYDWTTEMPYFWFSFFKIDGTSCKIDDSLKLYGNAIIYSSFDKIECLRSMEADKQDAIQIPPDLGFKEITLTPIPVPDFVKKTKIDNLESYVGCVSVLMNEECAINDEKNTFVEILVSTVQNTLNELIKILNEGQSKVQEHFESLKNIIEQKIKTECRKNQSFWKRFTSENIIETTIWFFSSDELKSLGSVSLVKYWEMEGVWELSGKVKLTEIQTTKKNKSDLKSRKKYPVSVI